MDWKRTRADVNPRKPQLTTRVRVALRAYAFGRLAAAWPGNADLWNNHALAALQNGDYDTAETSYGKALALAPDDGQLHNDLGILLEGLGRLDGAARAYREATRLRPDDDVAWANLGDVLRKQNRRREAIAAYREAERLAPEKWYYHRLWIRRLADPAAPASEG